VSFVSFFLVAPNEATRRLCGDDDDDEDEIKSRKMSMSTRFLFFF